MKYEVLEGKVLSGGKLYRAKDIIDISEKEAKGLVDAGKLKKIEASLAEKKKTTSQKKESSKKEE